MAEEATETTSPSRLRAWAEELRLYGWIHPLLGLVVTVASTSPARVGWAHAGHRLLISELFFCAIGLVVTAIYATWANRLLAHSGHWSPVGAMIHAATLVAGIGVGGELALLALPYIDPSSTPADVRPTLWRVGFSIGALTAIAGASYDRLRSRADNLELRAAKADRERMRAQLLAAQARMHPHFLFNSLNTLADLIEVDPETAVDATERLSSLLRYALEGERLPQVPLSRELQVIDDYIALERLRFEERLRFVADVDPAAREVPVPPFILQPVVENAIKHGVAKSRKGATVRLSARLLAAADERQLLELRVEDDAVAESLAAGTKSGHEDLRLRLGLLYGDQATLESGPRPGGGYLVRITLDPRALEPKS